MVLGPLDADESGSELCLPESNNGFSTASNNGFSAANSDECFRESIGAGEAALGELTCGDSTGGESTGGDCTSGDLARGEESLGPSMSSVLWRAVMASGFGDAAPWMGFTGEATALVCTEFGRDDACICLVGEESQGGRGDAPDICRYMGSLWLGSAS